MFFRDQVIGKYKILAPLGSGGFGTVFLAEDTWIDKKVALKVPHRQSLDFGELLREPRLLATLSHPNVVTVLTAERIDDVFFIVMEYVAGETLEAISDREGALDLGRALDFACQICNAVDHAHQQGIIHRDLRPGNVLVTETGIAKVADFGTSRFLEIAAHGTTVIGSPPYMAPEQFHGKAVFASDVYSLGVTMYQLLTGRLPYDAPAPGDLDKLMRGELTTSPRLHNPKIPEGDCRRRAQGDGTRRLAALRARARPARRHPGGPSGRRRPPAVAGRRHGRGRPRSGGQGHPRASPRPRHAAGALLLALRQAAARPNGHLSVLRREAVAGRLRPCRRAPGRPIRRPSGPVSPGLHELAWTSTNC